MLTGLAELGYVDGQNITLEFRFADHALERLPALAAELVAGQPDVLYTWTSGGARAAAAATSTIPIVVAPVNEGTMAALVPDFAHPPGNVTGLTLNNRQQHEKCLQLLKEAAPGITRVGVLLNPAQPGLADLSGGACRSRASSRCHAGSGGGARRGRTRPGICGDGRPARRWPVRAQRQHARRSIRRRSSASWS